MQPAVDQEALAARRVPGGVDQGDRDVAHLHDVPTVMGDEVAGAHAGGALHPGGLVGLDVDRAPVPPRAGG